MPGWPDPFVGFAFNIGFAGANVHTNNYGWQFAVWLLGVHLMFSQQQPMWYRDLYQRARDEADQLQGRLWVRDDHPHKVQTQHRGVASSCGPWSTAVVH